MIDWLNLIAGIILGGAGSSLIFGLNMGKSWMNFLKLLRLLVSMEQIFRLLIVNSAIKRCNLVWLGKVLQMREL